MPNLVTLSPTKELHVHCSTPFSGTRRRRCSADGDAVASSNIDSTDFLLSIPTTSVGESSATGLGSRRIAFVSFTRFYYNFYSSCSKNCNVCLKGRRQMKKTPGLVHFKNKTIILLYKGCVTFRQMLQRAAGVSREETQA